MRFVQKWSYSCARHLALALNENHNKKSIYYYGFYIVLSTLVKGVILVSTSLLLGTLAPSLLILLAFGSLRLVAGGYHFDTYGKCLLVSLALILLGACISRYTYTYWSTPVIVMLLLAVFAFSLSMLIRYAPKDTPTKPITDPAAIMMYKRLSIIYLGILLVLCCILTVFKLHMHIIAICTGILLEVFSITPTGHKFFNKIKVSLSKR